MMSHFSLAAFKILSLSFDSLIIIHLGVGLFKFILLRVHQAFWIYRLIFLKKSNLWDADIIKMMT